MLSNTFISTLLTILLILLLGVSVGYIHRMASGVKGPVQYAKSKEGFAPIRRHPSNFSPMDNSKPYHTLEYRELNKSGTNLLDSKSKSDTPFPYEITPMSSYAQVTNNINPSQWASPDNNNCSPSDICNNFYKPEHPNSSQIIFEENQKHFQTFSPSVTRVNMYGSSLELGPESINHKPSI